MPEPYCIMLIFAILHQVQVDSCAKEGQENLQKSSFDSPDHAIYKNLEKCFLIGNCIIVRFCLYMKIWTCHFVTVCLVIHVIDSCYKCACTRDNNRSSVGFDDCKQCEKVEGIEAIK